MPENTKSESAYKTIGEIAKELNLIDKKTGNLKTHTLRYWETQFKQIRPIIKAGKRRYYSNKDLQTLKLIKFLLKDKGYTINGVKSILKYSKERILDDVNKFGVYKADFEKKRIIKDKVNKISKIVKDIKKLK